MTVGNRLVLLFTGLLLLVFGGAGLLRGLGLWGEASSMVWRSDLVAEISANPWGVPATFAVAAGMAVIALGILLANLTPRSRLLHVARSTQGRTQIRTPSLLSALRGDICRELSLTQVQTGMYGRVGRPRINVWVVANSADSPRKLLTELIEGPAARVREAVAEPRLPVRVYLRFPAKISAQGSRDHTPVA